MGGRIEPLRLIGPWIKYRVLNKKEKVGEVFSSPNAN